MERGFAASYDRPSQLNFGVRRTPNPYGSTVKFAPGQVDFSSVAERYNAARGLSPAAVDAWRVAAAEFLLVASDDLILDLGAGTGRFTSLLADWSGASVVGVEPAARMREKAWTSASRSGVAFVAGRAEALPLRDRSLAAAWMAFVVHHISDLSQCAAEVRRVVRPGGRVLVANAFAGRLDGITFLRFFPEAREVAEAFPTLEAVAAAFAGVGFQREALRSVRQETCGSLSELAARTLLRADSTLALLTDEEFSRGQAALEHAARSKAPRPVVDILDLLVLRAV